tara:strand:- start:16662 stop:18212 length:1551 start_codon:yes stop_codon:yes gene_type:complete
MASVSAIKKDLRYLRELKVAKKRIDITRVGNVLKLGDLTYIPSPRGETYHQDRTSIVKSLKGPYGSGKSVTAVMDVVMSAMEMPLCKDGVRRSRWAVVRNTYGELETTTIKTWMDWLEGNLGRTHLVRKAPINLMCKFNDEQGKVEMEVIFLALDKPQHVKKLKSLEVTGALLEEAVEIPRDIYVHLIGRRGRYPKLQDLVIPAGHVGPQYAAQILMVTNAPDTDHWFYALFEVQKPKGYTLINQPPGLLENDDGEWIENEGADNHKHLRTGYYTEMAQGQSADFVKVYCNGEYGMVSAGKPVYTEYSDDLHSSTKLKYLDDIPLNLCWDFGLTPCCAVFQLTPLGHINVLKEYTSTRSGLTQFIKTVVIPGMSQEFGDYEIGFSVGDPSGKAGAQTDEQSCLNILDSLGFETFGAYSNSPIERIDKVKTGLSTLLEGRPQLMISQDCSVLRKGFIGSYQLERVAGEIREDYKDRPKKNFYSHIHDALQYGVMTVLRSPELARREEESNFKLTISA